MPLVFRVESRRIVRLDMGVFTPRVLLVKRRRRHLGTTSTRKKPATMYTTSPTKKWRPSANYLVSLSLRCPLSKWNSPTDGKVARTAVACLPSSIYFILAWKLKVRSSGGIWWRGSLALSWMHTIVVVRRNQGSNATIVGNPILSSSTTTGNSLAPCTWHAKKVRFRFRILRMPSNVSIRGWRINIINGCKPFVLKTSFVEKFSGSTNGSTVLKFGNSWVLKYSKSSLRPPHLFSW